MGPLAQGAVVGGCRIEGVIGRGGMGVVYRARQLNLDRDVALKVISPELVDDVEARQRFVSEAKAAGAVEHPNVVSVHAVGVEDERAYLVMRYVDGDDLRTLVRRDGPLEPDAAADVTRQLGAALDAIHAAGYVHRDVKPRNVLIGRDGHVYLSDFGLAKEALATSGPTASTQWVGTLDYVAPEQIRGGPVDGRTDVYALGGVLFFMLTGRAPFDRPTDEAKLWAHLHERPPVPSRARRELPAALDDVVARAMAKEPGERHASAGALGRAAEQAATGRGPPGTATTRRMPRARGHRARAAAVVVAVAAAAVGAWRLLGDRGADPPPEPAPRTPTPTATATATPGPRVVDTIRGVGVRPRDVVVAGGAVWVLSFHEDRIGRFDARTGRRLRRNPPVGRGGADLAVDRDRVWVAKPPTSGVLELDARSGRFRRRLDAPLPPVRVAAGRTGLWVVARTSRDGPASLLHYDRAGEVRRWWMEFPEGIDAIALGAGAAWLALRDPPRIVRVGTDQEVTGAGLLDDQAGALAFGAGDLWASVPDANAVVRIDPRRLEAVPTDVRGRPAGLAVARGRLFVARSTRHTVAVLDPRRLRRGPLRRLRMPLYPFAVAAGAGAVWVTGLAGGTVTRIEP